MKKCFGIPSVGIFLSLVFLIADDPELKTHVQDESRVSFGDTIYISAPVDSMSFIVSSKEYLPTQSFWIRNEATLLNLVVLLVIGLVVAWWTNRLNKRSQTIQQRREEKRRENIYCGNLYAVFHELQFQKSQSEIIQAELREIKRLSEDQSKIVIESMPSTFNTGYLHEFRMNILEYSQFNTKLLTDISSYLNLLTIINDSLDFKRVRETFDLVENRHSRLEAIQDYFSTLLRLFEDVDKQIPLISPSIRTEFEKFGQNIISNSEKLDQIASSVS